MSSMSAPILTQFVTKRRAAHGASHPPSGPQVAPEGPSPLLEDAEIRLALEEAALAATHAAQQVLSSTEFLTEALATLAAERERARPVAPAPPMVAPITPLSPRESEVLDLVAEGLTNKAIAATLFVSPNTVKTHVSSLLSKLDVRSRVQLATLAREPGQH